VKTINLVLRPVDDHFEGETIGVDSGALYCLNKGIKMIMAVGDFDSISVSDYKRLKESKVPLVKFPEAKNEIDFELALSYVQDYDQIVVYGGLGNRRDHEYTLMKFVMSDSRLIVVDQENRIQMRRKGKYVYKKGHYKYLSIIPLTNGMITLSGFKYPLKDDVINIDSHYLTSNEIIDEGIVELHEGKVLIIESK
jgi:thiamine pyrophosphokinase